MVNASLNWASIVGIVLAVCGAGLYFLRSFKPALARDYDVFFAAIGLLCGGILFFQGWRLDPILQFGQFLLAGTTVFFAYESVRLRGVATDQARRSSYFDDDPSPSRIPSGGLSGGWDDSYDQFEESIPVRRRFSGKETSLEEEGDEDFYRQRRTSRAAIPEQAASRRSRGRVQDQDTSWARDSQKARRMARFSREEESFDQRSQRSNFGDRRNARQEQRRGTRPSSNQPSSNSRRNLDQASTPSSSGQYSASVRSGRSQGVSRSSSRIKPEDASYSPSKSRSNQSQETSRRYGETISPRSVKPRVDKNTGDNSAPRDNSARFDD